MNESAIISQLKPNVLFLISLAVMGGGASMLVKAINSIFQDRADKKEKPSGSTKIIKVGEKYSLEKVICFDIGRIFYIVYRRYPFGIYKNERYSSLSLKQSEKEFKKLEAKVK